jgi:hypothetical protein
MSETEIDARGSKSIVRALTEIGRVILYARVRKAVNAETATKELRGSVLDVLRDLLVGVPSSEVVLEVVAKLVSRNHELEMLLATLRSSKHHNERVAKEQLDLFLDRLRAESESVLAKANETLTLFRPRPPRSPTWLGPGFPLTLSLLGVAVLERRLDLNGLAPLHLAAEGAHALGDDLRPLAHRVRGEPPLRLELRVVEHEAAVANHLLKRAHQVPEL